MSRLWSLIERVLGAVAALALAALVLLPALQVTLRDLFDSPLIGLEESTRWGLIILVFFGTPLLIATNEQIRLTEFVDRLPRLLRALLERVTLLAGAVVLAVIVWSGVLSIIRNFGTRTPTLDIPFWLFASPMLVGFAAGALGYLWVALRRDDPPVGGGPQIG
ncbi:MAG: TRAP transporter small permease [Bradyrhizobiaceae bacterium]|nr:MAG: TRAP transporter small permease [Bradyrhizobiaceae bacterium]